MPYSELYPVNNDTRSARLLDGLWRFQFDPDGKGLAEGWKNGLSQSISMPVPASFADFFTDRASRDYAGDFWYETEVYIPVHRAQERIAIRFGSLTHRADVFCNGIHVTFHEGGFLPVVADITDVAVPGMNRITLRMNNELSEKSLPCGSTVTLPSGRKLVKPYFDFFNYSGIHRSVWLMTLPEESVVDYDTTFALCGSDAEIAYRVTTNGCHPVHVVLRDASGAVTAEANGAEGTLYVKDARLWQVRNAYLYTLEIVIRDGAMVLDRYTAKIGIRTVEIRGKEILINGAPVYLKGFGKHEDFDVFGRGFSWSIAKRDFECMKWTEANCFRTSHYPYAEEWYQFADEEGFLIIDEVPAVGMMRSMMNFAAAGSGKYTYFFEAETVPELKKNHLLAVEEMIARDKNHPSVIAWSLFNEPETISEYAEMYFRDIFALARTLDAQRRPLTGALEKTSSPAKCRCYPMLDFICLNRYYGWYIAGGAEIEEAERLFREEMDAWQALDLNVPFVFTEFGTDTLASEHKLPSVMWSQEYQNAYLKMYFDVFDTYDFVQGELVWNFADFQTSEGILRVNGNKKGVFTRNRQPKDAAYVLKKRWESR